MVDMHTACQRESNMHAQLQTQELNLLPMADQDIYTGLKVSS